MKPAHNYHSIFIIIIFKFMITTLRYREHKEKTTESKK